MSTIQPMRYRLNLAALAALSLAPLAALMGLAAQAGWLAMHPNIGFGLCALLVSGHLGSLAWRLEGFIRSAGVRPTGGPVPVVETLTTVEDFVDRLERLAAGCTRLWVLDVNNMTRHLVAAPRFLSAGCAPRLDYRQISNIDSEKGFEDLVRLIRRGAPAEDGTYYCLRERSVLSAWSSFCVLEREDGFYVFLVHRTSDQGSADIVLMHDETLGRLMLRQYQGLWSQLAETESPFFSAGRFAEERSVGEPGEAPRELRAA